MPAQVQRRKSSQGFCKGVIAIGCVIMCFQIASCVPVESSNDDTHVGRPGDGANETPQTEDEHPFEPGVYRGDMTCRSTITSSNQQQREQIDRNQFTFRVEENRPSDLPGDRDSFNLGGEIITRILRSLDETQNGIFYRYDISSTDTSTGYLKVDITPFQIDEMDYRIALFLAKSNGATLRQDCQAVLAR